MYVFSPTLTHSHDECMPIVRSEIKHVPGTLTLGRLPPIVVRGNCFVPVHLESVARFQVPGLGCTGLSGTDIPIRYLDIGAQPLGNTFAHRVHRVHGIPLKVTNVVRYRSYPLTVAGHPTTWPRFDHGPHPFTPEIYPARGCSPSRRYTIASLTPRASSTDPTGP